MFEDPDDGEMKCHVTVFTKIFSKPLHYIFDEIDDLELFNPKAAIRKLRIKFDQGKQNVQNTMTTDQSQNGEPYLTLYDELDDVFVETFSDTVYFMTP